MKNLANIISNAMPLLNAIPDALCIIDNNGKNVFSNDVYKKMIKQGKSELVSDSKEIKINNQTIGKITIYHDTSELKRLKLKLDCVNQKLRKVQTKYDFKDIIGNDSKIKQVINTAKIVAMTPATIIIRGESGTGKEIFANAIHNNSTRQNERFVKINCASLPEDLLESELFGFSDGAFTGARRGGKKGLFQEADKGTLFLDEIGDISLKMQVKLLRALQEKEILPIGALTPIKVDVRIICATNKPLEKMIENGEFREDLYYRLNVFPLFIPPLRERKEDIKYIVMYLLNKYNEFYDRNINKIDDQAIILLQQNEWKGNVRELENIISRVLINMERDNEVITKENIESALNNKNNFMKCNTKNTLKNLPNNINDAVRMTEKYCIEHAIEKYNGNKNKAAVELGIPLRTLYYKCKKLGI